MQVCCQDGFKRGNHSNLLSGFVSSAGDKLEKHSKEFTVLYDEDSCKHILQRAKGVGTHCNKWRRCMLSARLACVLFNAPDFMLGQACTY